MKTSKTTMCNKYIRTRAFVICLDEKYVSSCAFMQHWTHSHTIDILGFPPKPSKKPKHVCKVLSIVYRNLTVIFMNSPLSRQDMAGWELPDKWNINGGFNEKKHRTSLNCGSWKWRSISPPPKETKTWVYLVFHSLRGGSWNCISTIPNDLPFIWLGFQLSIYTWGLWHCFSKIIFLIHAVKTIINHPPNHHK